MKGGRRGGELNNFLPVKRGGVIREGGNLIIFFLLKGGLLERGELNNFLHVKRGVIREGGT